MQKIIEKNIDTLRYLCNSLGIVRLYAFGSVVTDKFDANSDIDFLISFDENLSIEEYTTNYFTFQYKLREIFNREIDVVTERTLSNPYFIQSIDESKQLIYEA
jgi:predicted nucleotidyltransferase